jgi:urate oxidase
MSAPKVVSQSYGKSCVRLSRITRDGARHDFAELTVSIALDGDFNATYEQAARSMIVATDTMKNTVYVLASRLGVRSIEEFSQALATHFLQHYSHVSLVTVKCEEHPWARMQFAGVEHPHAFVGGTTERYVCEYIGRAGGGATLSSGLEGLQVLKTTGSEFTEFLRDEYTTLPDATDRILATSIEASWKCRDLQANWTNARQQIRSAFLDVFANQHSKSVQHTLYEMAKVAFEKCPLVDEISIRMPNQHHLLVNLAPFGLKNPNEVFTPTSAPFGDISATIRRGD